MNTYDMSHRIKTGLLCLFVSYFLPSISHSQDMTYFATGKTLRNTAKREQGRVGLKRLRKNDIETTSSCVMQHLKSSIPSACSAH